MSEVLRAFDDDDADVDESPAAEIAADKPRLVLNEGQATALEQIITSYRQKMRRYLLTGFAGTGKTTLMEEVVRTLRGMPRYADIPNDRRKVRVAVTAPTHKAVQVLARKLAAAGLFDIEICTIHALLGLKPGVSDSEKMVLKRSGAKSRTGDFDAIIIDECSMIGTDLQGFIDGDLAFHWVLYVGDPAQLPPVGEVSAPCFNTTEGSHLETIVRQAEGNPILHAATALRQQQGNAVNWDWCKPAENGPYGIFLAGDDADAWMHGAFTSEEFKADNDAFRYIAYTNERVKEVNAKIRHWIYGPTETPFVEGERVLCRNPIMENERNNVAFTTNQEAVVSSISAGRTTFTFGACEGGPGKHALPEWQYDLPVWKVGLLHPELGEVVCDLAQNEAEVKQLDRKLVTEAKANRSRWFDRFQFIEKIADLRPVYALTCHSSQGSTFDNVFVDVPDMTKRERFNPLEMQQLLYVAVTRPRFALVLVGV